MRGWFRARGRTLVNMLLAVLMVTLYVTTATPVAQSAMSELYGSPLYRGHREDAVALCCSVSWDAAALPTLLDTLRARETRITFFVSGDWAQANPETLRQIAADGHELGTLGQTPGNDGGLADVMRDVLASVEAVNAACGVRPALYHSGTREARTSARAAQKLGMTHVLGTVDILSARGSAQDVLARALDRTFGGSILLMQPTGEAVKALPACLDALKDMGFTATTVSGVVE